MNNIQLSKAKFQLFLDWLNYIWQLGFGELPVQPVEIFTYPVYTGERQYLLNAVAAFELKKQGGAK